MNSPQKIPLFLINGFLGSGKTTFLKNIVKKIPNLKVGCIENEFGEEGVDGLVLSSENMKIVEINNGSIFCNCRHHDFIEALIQIADFALDIIFIESSGISDPSSIESDLKIVEKKIGLKYLFQGSVCLVDATNFIEYLDLLEVLRRQIYYSTYILINKIDLVDNNRMHIVKQNIREINQNAHIIETTFGQIQIEILNQIPHSKISSPSSNTKQNSPQKIVLKSTKKLSKSKFYSFIESFAHETFRIKGFMKLDDHWHFVDCVRDIIHINPTQLKKKSDKISSLIIILRKGDSLGDLIKKQWDQLFVA